MSLTSDSPRGTGLGRIGASLKWVYAANAVSASTQLVTTVVLARLLTPESFGAFAVLVVIAAAGTVVATAGLDTAVIQAPELGRRDVVRIRRLVAVVAGTAAGAMLLYVGIAPTEEAGPLRGIVFVAALLIPLNVQANISAAQLRRVLDFRPVSAVDAASYVLVFAPVSLMLAAGGYGLWTLPLATIAQALFRTSAHQHIAARRVHLPDVSALDLRRAVRLGIPSAAYNLLNATEDVVVNGTVASLGLWTAGVFNRADRIRQVFQQQVGFPITNVLLSHFSRKHADGTRYDEELSTALTWLHGVMLPVCMVAAVFSAPIVAVLLGAQFGQASTLFRILVWMCPALVASALLSNAVVASGRTEPSMYVQAAALLALGAVAWRTSTAEAFAAYWLLIVWVRYGLYFENARRYAGVTLGDWAKAHGPGASLAFAVLLASAVYRYYISDSLVPGVAGECVATAGGLAVALIFLWRRRQGRDARLATA